MQTGRKTHLFSQRGLCVFLLHLHSNRPTCLVFTFGSMAWWILKCVLTSIGLWENALNWAVGLLFRLSDCDVWSCDCLPPISASKCSLVVFYLGQCVCIKGREERSVTIQTHIIFVLEMNQCLLFVFGKLFKPLNRFCLRLESNQIIKMYHMLWEVKGRK